VKDFEVDVPPNRYKELYDLANELGEKSIKPFPSVGDLKRVSPNVFESLLLGGWKPQLAVTGVEGLPELAKAGNVLLPFTAAKISLRIPPTKNPEEAKAFLVKTLTENPPYDAKITLTNVFAG